MYNGRGRLIDKNEKSLNLKQSEKVFRSSGEHTNIKLDYKKIHFMEDNYNDSELNEEIVLDNELDTEELEDLSGKRKIYTEQGDPEINSLHRRFKKGILNVQPSFQRQFVWDKVKCSRLIESALLDIPIPIIYLSEEQDRKENVIDGQQRLTAFFSFIDGKFPDNTDFKLTGLNVFIELNGKKFNQLSDELQEKIITYKIRAIKFKKESDGDLQFEIFARLNSGSVQLNDQELRNCVFRGRFNEVVKELAQDRDFKYLLGIASPDKRMKDRELVLRFAAFYFNTYLNYSAPIKKFLNDSMEKYRNISTSDEENLKTAFKNAIQIIKSLLDKKAFKRYYRGDEKNINGKWEAQQFNVSLFDILMYSFAREDKNKVFQNLERISEALIDLMTNDQDFIDSIELSTSSKRAVTIRFDKWRFALQSIIGIGIKEPRCFSFQLKQELFASNDICAICSNKIQHIDDAAVDHIQQYWTGGKTIPINARLTHRYCNNARPRIENNSLVITREEEPEQLISSKSKGGVIEKIKREPREARTVDQHLKGASSELKDLFSRIDIEIMNISSEVERHTTNAYIIYKTSLNFAYLGIQKRNNCLSFQIRTSNDKMDDPKNISNPIPYYRNFTRQVNISPEDEKSGKCSLGDVMHLLYQSYYSTQYSFIEKPKRINLIDNQFENKLAIGKYVNKTFREIVDAIDKEEVEKLLNKDYSKVTFHIDFSFLIKNKENLPYEIIRRYYKVPVLILGESYFFCSQWFENSTNNDRPYYESWLKKMRRK
jgi:predicted transport protein